MACLCLVYVALAASKTGTGFLIAAPLGALVWFRYIITNNHVIPDIETARKTLLDFRSAQTGTVTQCTVHYS
jgi:S1-C subfamily serine protease